MKLVPPSRWPLVVTAHAAAGVATAVAVQALLVFASRMGIRGIRSGIASGLMANIAWPTIVAAFGVWYPRFRTVWLGSVLLVLGFVITGALLVEPYPWRWSFKLFAEYAHPFIFGTIAACGLVGSVCVLFTQTRRQVGVPYHGQRCTECGFAIGSLDTARCPECGSEIDPRG